MKKLILIMMAGMILLGSGCKKIETVDIDNDQHQEVEVTQQADTAEGIVMQSNMIPEGAEDVTILLMGSMSKDFSKDENAYCLTHILITLNTKNQKIKFTTFPYNLAVKTGDDQSIVQLQQVCMDGGEDYAVEVLENNFGIDIDYWVVMNMKGVIDIVDAVEGIEIEISDLSINEAAMYIVEMLNLTWEEVVNTGRQKLNGVQTAGYFVDTWTETDEWMMEEEIYFREHHSNIIKGLIESVLILQFDSDDLIQIAESSISNYSTNIPDDKWESISVTAIYCIENEAEFYHIPNEITLVETDAGWQSFGYTDKDVDFVKDFIGE